MPLIGCRPVLMGFNICFFHWCKSSDIFLNHQIKSHLFLNKMHFYCFLPSLSTDSLLWLIIDYWLLITDYWLLIRFFFQQRITLITLIIRAVCVICCSPLFIRFIWFIWWLSFFCEFCAFCCFFSTSDTTDLTDFSLSLSFPFPLPLSLSFSFFGAHSGIEPGATPCRGGRCAAHYPHGPQQPANKNT